MPPTTLLTSNKDPVDEFVYGLHPFSEQVALIDKCILDIKAVRDRYQAQPARVQQLNGQTDADSGVIVVDPFDDFRSTRPANLTVSTVTLESGTYDQVPSRYSKIDPMVSIHSVKNKSDTPGEKHPGVSADTRFGTTGKPPFNTVPRREQNGQNTQNGPNNRNNTQQNGQSGSAAPAETRRCGYGQQNGQHQRQGSSARYGGRRGRRQDSARNSIQGPRNERSQATETPPNEQYQASQVIQLENERQLTPEEYTLLTNAYNTTQLANQRILVYPNQQVFGMFTPQQTPGSGLSGGLIQQAVLQSYASQPQYDVRLSYEQMQNGAREENVQSPLDQNGSPEYARFLDDMNNESRAQGERVLRGDLINGESQVQVFPPSPGQTANTRGTSRVVMPNVFNGGRQGEANMFLNPFAEGQPRPGSTTPISNLLLSRSPSYEDAEILPPSLLRTSSENDANRRPYVTYGQDRQKGRQDSVHSPSMYNPAGRSQQGINADLNRVNQRIHSQPPGFGDRRTSSPGLSVTSSEDQSVSFQGAGNTIFGQLPGSISRGQSPLSDFRRVNATAGRRLWESSRASSPGIGPAPGVAAGPPDAVLQRGRFTHLKAGSPGRRSVSEANLRGQFLGK
jgi:hypothetical protein